MPRFGRSSRLILAELHPQLREVAGEAIKYFDFRITAGYRGQEDQDKAVQEGFSQLRWPNSRHNRRPAEAMDCVPWPVDWNDIGRFHEMAGVILTVAKQQGIGLAWGGHWRKFKDRPHFELTGL